MCFGLNCFAADPRPSLYIDSDKEVNSGEILLGDISFIRGNDQVYSKLITDLKAVSLGDAPRPLASKKFRGEDILAAIEEKEIPREAFGYSIPKEITVRRSGRILGQQEVLDSLKNKISSDSSLDLQVKKVTWESDQVLPLGAVRIDSELLGGATRGKLPVRISVLMDDNVAARFLATAVVDDWKSIPILNSRMERGMLVNPSDIQMIRTNLADLPPDIATSVSEISGKRLKKTVNYGEPLRRSDIDIPPVIEKGKIIKMRFQSGNFSAVASGVAMQSGQTDDLIEVRNDRSNKVVKGKVISPDEVLISN